MALSRAIGAISTAVAVLLIKSVIKDVVKYTPAKSIRGPKLPNVATSDPDIISDTPVFSRANDIGIMAAIKTILSQLIVL